MTALRLRTFDETEQEQDASYPFPLADSGAPDIALESDAPEDSLELAQRIEATLDQLQQRLDQVKDELDSVYRFPSPDDFPPVAA